MTVDGVDNGPEEPREAFKGDKLLEADSGPTRVERLQATLTRYVRRAEAAGEKHASVAVPFRAANRNKRLATSVLAGGFAYRLFFWLLPFGLVVGGVLGFLDSDTTEEALAAGGLPAVAAQAIGEAARDSGTARWVLLAIGVPTLIWSGYTGAKATALIHGLVWDDPPQRKSGMLKSSLGFTAACLLFIAMTALTSWIRETSSLAGLLVMVMMIVPTGALWLWVSLWLPHGAAVWRMLLPGAVLVGTGILVLHGLTAYVVLPNLEHSAELYGTAGGISVFLFWMYLLGRLVVMSPVLNSSLHEELLTRRGDGGDQDTPQAPSASSESDPAG